MERPARCLTHPAELLREILTDGMKLSVAAAARQLGVSRMTLHRLLRAEHAVTPKMALRLGKLCGNGPELWLRMQMAHDLWRLERTLRASRTSLPTARGEEEHAGTGLTSPDNPDPFPPSAFLSVGGGREPPTPC